MTKTYFYRAAVIKIPIGTALEYKEPAIYGDVLKTIPDTATRGSNNLVVINASPEQHEKNKQVPGVTELTNDEAMSLAPQYRPARTIREVDPTTQEVTQIEIPAADISSFISEDEV